MDNEEAGRRAFRVGTTPKAPARAGIRRNALALFLD
jgi:hypothetical protein